MAKQSDQIVIKLTKSLNGRLPTHKACARGLGLSRMNQVKTVAATPENLGMINKIRYLLTVEEAQA